MFWRASSNLTLFRTGVGKATFITSILGFTTDMLGMNGSLLMTFAEPNLRHLINDQYIRVEVAE